MTTTAQIKDLSREEFLEEAFTDTGGFLDRIGENQVYMVRNFWPREQILEFRSFLNDFKRSREASWHPCLDGVPDYHRINDEYEKSWVKARMHSFYFHRFNEHKDLFEPFRDIFALKNHLAGESKGSHYDTIPSDGTISRLVSHQYPRGGGYLAEHVDPTNPFAKIQTIIQASDVGEDFQEGGLYMRESEDAEPFYIDPLSNMGDLMVLSPDVRHAVAPVDPDREVDWDADDGRWMILPIIIRSDYEMDPETKPKSV